MRIVAGEKKGVSGVAKNVKKFFHEEVVHEEVGVRVRQQEKQ